MAIPQKAYPDPTFRPTYTLYKHHPINGISEKGCDLNRGDQGMVSLAVQETGVEWHRSTAGVAATSAIGYWNVDVSTELVTADVLVAFLFGFDPEQAQQGITFQTFNSGVHPDDRAYALERISDCIRNGGWFVAEHRVCSKDGQVRRIFARGLFDKDDTGVVTSGRGIVVDLTHSKETDDPSILGDLRSSRTPLERATDLILASHAALEAANEPRAMAILEALLMELGRSLARSQAHAHLSLPN